MKPLSELTQQFRKGIRFVLTDIDDTVTLHGRIITAALAAMEELQRIGIKIIPITGRPAGWCDHIARMWPVDAVVGENGAFYFHYDRRQRRMVRRYWKSAEERDIDRIALNRIADTILRSSPGTAVAADQAFRIADLAIDFCEDVAPLPVERIDRIAKCFEEAGAQAKISSIHVNGWFGAYDKLAMTRKLFEEIFAVDLGALGSSALYIGDSPNDAPMFAFFENSVGVANIKAMAHRIDPLPRWITETEGGYGFAELAKYLLS
jgi:HAD superfamily hydrolase (TIGR01484 family)